MTELLIRYDEAVDKIQPGRTYFFESLKGTCYGRDWVNDNFKKIWESANGTAKGIVPYDVRHHYAVENINSWEDDSFTFSEKLHCLSKSMGHRHILLSFWDTSGAWSFWSPDTGKPYRCLSLQGIQGTCGKRRGGCCMNPTSACMGKGKRSGQPTCFHGLWHCCRHI